MKLAQEETDLINLYRLFMNDDDRALLISFLEDITSGGHGALCEWMTRHLQLQKKMNKARLQQKRKRI